MFEEKEPLCLSLSYWRSQARQELDVIFEAMNEENDRLMKDSKDLISAVSNLHREILSVIGTYCRL